MSLSGWGGVAAILLAIEAFVFVLVVGGSAYFLIRGTLTAKARITPLAAPVRLRMEMMASATRRLSEAVVEPFARFEAAGAAVLAAVQILVLGSRRRERATDDEA